MYAYGSWTTLSFTLLTSPGPTVDQLQLRSPAGTAEDGTPQASNSTLTGHVADSTGLPGLTVQVSLDGGATILAAVGVDSSGNFNDQPTQLAFGTVVVSARPSWWDAAQQAFRHGPWQTLTFDYCPPNGALPAVTALDADGQQNITSPNVTGQINSGLSLSGVTVEIDDGGSAALHAVTDSLGNFSCTLSDLPYGTTTVRARASQLDPATQQILAGDWASFTLTYHAARR